MEKKKLKYIINQHLVLNRLNLTPFFALSLTPKVVMKNYNQFFFKTLKNCIFLKNHLNNKLLKFPLYLTIFQNVDKLYEYHNFLKALKDFSMVVFMQVYRYKLFSTEVLIFMFFYKYISLIIYQMIQYNFFFFSSFGFFWQNLCFKKNLKFILSK